MLDAKESSFKSVQDYNGLSDIFVFLCFILNRNLAVRMAQFKFSVASPRGANQKMVQHDTG